MDIKNAAWHLARAAELLRLAEQGADRDRAEVRVAAAAVHVQLAQALEVAGRPPTSRTT